MTFNIAKIQNITTNDLEMRVVGFGKVILKPGQEMEMIFDGGLKVGVEKGLIRIVSVREAPPGWPDDGILISTNIKPPKFRSIDEDWLS